MDIFPSYLQLQQGRNGFLARYLRPLLFIKPLKLVTSSLWAGIEERPLAQWRPRHGKMFHIWLQEIVQEECFYL